MTDPKQEIFEILYQFEGWESLLNVGCGWDYAEKMNKSGGIEPGDYYGLDILFNQDWCDFEPKDYDIIIADDLFPNVDQRLEMFLEKYLPHCKEMRLSLTYFDEPKWYRATRPGGEVITMLAWTEYQIIITLGDRLDCYRKYEGTFPNGRRVLLVWLKGGLA